MHNAFVTHSHADTDFAAILVKLLRVHCIQAWLSEIDLSGGARFREEIAAAIGSADVLAVIVSQSSVTSKWVHTEISAFRSAKPDGMVIPIRLDATEPNAVFGGLSEFQCIDFSQSMLKGFDDLLTTLGKQFLGTDSNQMKRRNGDSRRKGDRRKAVVADRRMAPLIVRLRKGFWLAFYHATELEKHIRFPVNLHHLEKVVNGVLSEAQKYRYVEKQNGMLRVPKQALTSAASRIWERMRDWDLQTINVVEAVVEQIYQDYDVTQLDRRSTARRDLTVRRKAATAG